MSNDYRPQFAIYADIFKVDPSELSKYPTTAGKDKNKWYKDRSTRIKHYDKWESIYEGNHLEIWGKDLTPDDRERYVVFNAIKPIIHTIARLLVINNPQFTVQDDFVQEWLDKVIKDNQLIEELENAVVSGQVLSGIVLRTGYKGNPTIRFIHPRHLEPLFDPWDASRPIGYKLIFENEVDGTEFKKVEYYTENLYVEEQYVKEKGKAEFQLVGRTPFPHEAGILTQYISFNPALFNLWGSSIIQDTEPLLKEVNNRMSRLKRVLDIFASPKLILPPSIFDNLFEDHNIMTDTQGTKYVRIGEEDIYCMNPDLDGDQKPEYLTWDANTQAAFDMLKQVLSALSVMTDVPAYTLKNDEEGLAPQSGAALKILFTQTWNKAMSIAKVLAKALETALWQAQLLEGQIGTELAGKKPEWVTVNFIDGLPLDENYITTEINKYNNGLQSRETTIRNIDNYNSRQLAEEIQRIEEEENKSMESSIGRLQRNDFSVKNVEIPVEEENEEGEE